MTAAEIAAPLDHRERIDRMRARAWVVQILYLWDARGSQEPLSETMATTLASRRISPRRAPLVRGHVDRLERYLSEIDEAIGGCVENWRPERLSRIDRAILRLTAAEILFSEDVPPKVAIQEGIRLAGQYGGAGSPAFVNGVLDALYKARDSEDGGST